MGKEVIAHEEANKDKIVYHPLKIIAKRDDLETRELGLEVFSEDGNMEHLEWLVVRESLYCFPFLWALHGIEMDLCLALQDHNEKERNSQSI